MLPVHPSIPAPKTGKSALGERPVPPPLAASRGARASVREAGEGGLCVPHARSLGQLCEPHSAVEETEFGFLTDTESL